MTVGPLRERYRAALAAHGYSADPAQQRAIASLERVWRELQNQPSPGMLEHLLARLNGEPPEQVPVRGLYLWGGVGHGKTFLMDLFFHALPSDRKLRLHFHRFMQQVHAELKSLQEQEDPLQAVAVRLASKTRVICFDEFFVSDIADAMILGRLFDWLFRYGVTLIGTSNGPPDELYKDGLQRARFLPAISLLHQHCEILHVDAGVDYRLRALESVEIYHWPLDAAADEAMERYFRELNPDGSVERSELLINDRLIPARRLGEGIVWFDFNALCEGPRAVADYIEIAREYHTVLLSDVPMMGPTRENDARRFIMLVDEFYDRRVKLILSAAVAMESLYTGEKLHFEFQRTFSRLREMQTREYLSLPHRA